MSEQEENKSKEEIEISKRDIEYCLNRFRALRVITPFFNNNLEVWNRMQFTEASKQELLDNLDYICSLCGRSSENKSLCSKKQELIGMIEAI